MKWKITSNCVYPTIPQAYTSILGAYSFRYFLPPMVVLVNFGVYLCLTGVREVPEPSDTSTANVYTCKFADIFI